MLNSPIEEIKSRLDIVDIIQGYIRLQKAGMNYRAVCPFHSEKKPSFFVSPARQIFKCFGCGAGGNIFEFVMRMDGVEFGDALKILAQKAGVELKRQDPQMQTERQHLLQICELACKFFEKQFAGAEAGIKARKYILNRGISEESIKNWRVGYAPNSWQGLLNFLNERGYKNAQIEKSGLAIKKEPESASIKLQATSYKLQANYYDRFRGRIMFPIFDLNGQVVGFGGRIFGEHKRPDGQEEAKYINSPQTLIYDKSGLLYGLDRAKVEIRKKGEAVLVEGYTDVIMSHQAGAQNVVATSGTSLTALQLRILKRYCENLLTCFDMDIAGDSATKRSIELAMRDGFNVKVVMLPQDLDPADVIKDQIAEWEKAVASPKGIIDFYFDGAFARFDAKKIDGKKDIAKILLPILKRIPSQIEQSHWIAVLAQNLGVKEADISEDMKKIKYDSLDDYRFEEPEIVPLPPSQKSRRDLLEERILSLLMKNPECIEEVRGAPIANTSAAEILRGFSELKICPEAGQIAPSMRDFPASVAAFYTNLILREEMDGTADDLDFSKEIRLCCSELKSLDIRERLDKLEERMKHPESNDAADDNLLKEFNDLSRELMSLERQKTLATLTKVY